MINAANKWVIDRLRAISPSIEQKYGVTRIGIFGSVARNQDRIGSDIDIFVEMRPDLLKRAALKTELESVLGKKVDVIRYWRGMNKILKRRIDNEGLYV